MFEFKCDYETDEGSSVLDEDEYFSSLESDAGGLYSSDDSDDDSVLSESEATDLFNLNFNEPDVEFSFDNNITKELTLWAIKFFISHSALTALLNILRKFGHTDLPKLARTLLRTPRKAVTPRVCLPGFFFYRGIQFNLLNYNNTELKEMDTINVDFFIDGLSVSEISKVKMWPIMGSFVDIPNLRPFVVGCYAGKGDPANVDDYMREFVEELKFIIKNGVDVTKDRVHKKFRFRCFIADSPARAFATGTMSHASYFGCPKCNQVCFSVGHKLYYQWFVGELRTDESFQNRDDINHHKPEFQTRSLLLESIIGMISQFVIDCMHAVDLGVTKKIIKAVINNESPCSKITKAIFASLNARFQSFKSYVPSEFVRKPRTLSEVNQFKANEFRQLLLYTLPVLFKDLIGSKLYKQFLTLHIAIRLLSDPKRYKDNLNAARALINDFVDKYDETFGAKNFTFNTHCLLHLPDYVELYGPLYSFSAYKYENHMRLIKRLLRRKNGHIQQFFNRVEEMRLADEMYGDDGSRNETIYNECIFKANSLNDSCCMLESGIPFIITSSFLQNGLRMIRGYRYTKCEDFYDDTLPSMSNMGIVFARNLSTNEEQFSADSILHKFFRLPHEDGYVLVPLLHLA